MHVVARVTNSAGTHAAYVATDNTPHSLTIAPKASGRGSSVNGGELLFLALATYCNDLYREAYARSITVHAVEVEVNGEFGGRGEPASGIAYRATVRADATDAQIKALLEETDRVAEIQNTVRRGCSVRFEGQA
ncbi:MAG: OsmC family protein [Gemmatimonadaceae bacterium]